MFDKSYTNIAKIEIKLNIFAKRLSDLYKLLAWVTSNQHLQKKETDKTFYSESSLWHWQNVPAIPHLCI